jgi:hypothetical protein
MWRERIKEMWRERIKRRDVNKRLVNIFWREKWGVLLLVWRHLSYPIYSFLFVEWVVSSIQSLLLLLFHTPIHINQYFIFKYMNMIRYDMIWYDMIWYDMICDIWCEMRCHERYTLSLTHTHTRCFQFKRKKRYE